MKTKLLVCLLLLALSQTSIAATVSAVALFKDRAMLSIDGSKAKIIKAGARYKGVTLVSSNTSEAVVEMDGVRKTLRLNGTSNVGLSLGGKSTAISGSVTIYVNQNGFFKTMGQVNGRSTEFLVDTGANLVVFNSVQADRLSIDYLSGQKGTATTASGRAPMYLVSVDSIAVGGIRLQDIDVGIIEGSFPEMPLLGMTFLQKLDMTRSGGTMVLKTRN